MTRERYAGEKTRAGYQFVIPGTEREAPRPVKRFAVDRDGDRDQYVLPGAERIGTGALVARLAAKPIRPRRGQKSVDGTALFGNRAHRG